MEFSNSSEPTNIIDFVRRRGGKRAAALRQVEQAVAQGKRIALVSWNADRTDIVVTIYDKEHPL